MSDKSSVPRGPSIYDVAAAAGVSQMTVSRVLNDAPHIRDTTRARVLAAIAALEYHPSSAARSLATNRTMRLGAVINTSSQFGPASTLIALERAVRARGYGLIPLSHDDGADHIVEAGIIELTHHGVDGVCVIGPSTSTVPALAELGLMLPIVVVGESAFPGLISVDIDQAQGAEEATRHLIALGHRRIIHLSGPMDSSVAAAREAAWRRALEEVGGHPKHVEGDWTSDSGYMLGSDARIIGDSTAIFAGNDQMAFGVIHGLASRGKQVPADISVVGFDDMPGAAHYLPALTTVRQDFTMLGERIADAIISVIAGRGDELQATSIPAKLTDRASTARYPHTLTEIEVRQSRFR